MKRGYLFGISVILVIAGLVTWVLTRPKDDSLRVPLGVEQAAIVTHGGPVLVVAPYKWGVAVNVRIAEVIEQPDRRIYDLRYIVNREGTFDLKDYLAAEDGSALDSLPSFQFTGDPKLSKNLDTRIRETEEIRIDVGGRYVETMTVLALLWIGWLFLLIFWKRPQPSAGPDAELPGPTLAERLRDFLAQLEAGTLDAESKAKLEMTMLRCWREELAVSDLTMSAALHEIARGDQTGEALRRLQHWLHHPASSVENAEIVAVLQGYAADGTDGTYRTDRTP
jgi:hypothetical protein